MSLTCFEMASSVLNSSSRALFLMYSNRAVAMFIWVSNVAFRARSSGKAVMAFLR